MESPVPSLILPYAHSLARPLLLFSWTIDSVCVDRLSAALSPSSFSAAHRLRRPPGQDRQDYSGGRYTATTRHTDAMMRLKERKCHAKGIDCNKTKPKPHHTHKEMKKNEWKERKTRGAMRVYFRVFACICVNLLSSQCNGRWLCLLLWRLSGCASTGVSQSLGNTAG